MHRIQGTMVLPSKTEQLPLTFSAKTRGSTQRVPQRITLGVGLQTASLPCVISAGSRVRIESGQRFSFWWVCNALSFLSLLGVLSSSLLAQEGAGSAAVPGQAPGEMFSSYEGQNVSSIELAGQPDLDPAKFASTINRQVNHPFSQENIQQTAAEIKSAGKFEDVRLQVDPESNGIRVTYILEPAVYFGI